MPEEVDRYPTDPLDGPAQFKDMLAGLTRRIAQLEGVGGGVPVGVMWATRNASLDSGYLWCDGAAIPAEHTALIAICGLTTPDMRGCTFVGLDNMGGTDAGRLTSANTLGLLIGAEKHVLTEAELPSSVWMNSGGFGVQGGSGLSIRLPGANAAHNNVQPSRTCNVIIKY